MAHKAGMACAARAAGLQMAVACWRVLVPWSFLCVPILAATGAADVCVAAGEDKGPNPLYMVTRICIPNIRV